VGGGDARHTGAGDDDVGDSSQTAPRITRSVVPNHLAIVNNARDMKLVIAIAWLAPVWVAAQAGPLTPDRHSDFHGVYRYDTMTPVERPREFASKGALTGAEADEFLRRRRTELARGPATYDEVWLERPQQLITIDGKQLTSRIIDPPDGRIPALTPEAERRLAAEAEQRRLHPADDPEGRTHPERCLSPAPIIEPGGEANLLEIVQTPEHLVVHTELMNVVRIVPIRNLVVHPAG